MSATGPAFLTFASSDLSLREDRQRLIASNIANADTPGYRARDIPFAKLLAASLNGDGAPDVRPEYVQSFPVGLDGNDVSLTAEKIESIHNVGAMKAETTYLHQATTDLISALRPNPNGI